MNNEDRLLIHFEAFRSWFTDPDKYNHHRDNFEKQYPRTYNALMTNEPLSFDIPEFPSEYTMGRLVFEPENREELLQLFDGITYEHFRDPEQVYGIVSKHGKPYARVQGYAFVEPKITYL